MSEMVNEVNKIIQEFFKKEQKEKIDKYRILNEQIVKGQILFTGSSLMEHFPVNELLMTERMDAIIYNRGVGGFTTDDMLENMETQVFGTEPSKIFINIGTNDISTPSITFEEALEHMLTNYEKILMQIKKRLPETKVYLMAYYPVKENVPLPDGGWGQDMFKNRNNTNLPIANKAVQKLADRFGYNYIDVNTGLADEDGNLKTEYTIEGVHMYANAYRVVFENMKSYL